MVSQPLKNFKNRLDNYLSDMVDMVT